MKTLTRILVIITFLLSGFSVSAKPPKNERSKFYDFSEQLIDGEIRKPTALYTNARGKVKFDRLLRLKKSFIPNLFDTAKEKVFK